MANYYEILEVERTATEKDIKSAYRKLAKKWHPDTTQFDKDYAASKFKEVTNAYNVLSDAEARKQYDYNLDYEVRLREETRRREQARREAEARRREQERQEAERRRKEQARQEAERHRQEKERIWEEERRQQERDKQAAETRRREQERQEAERCRQEQERQEAERRRQERERMDENRRQQEGARQKVEQKNYKYKYSKKVRRQGKILNRILYALFGFKSTWYKHVLAFVVPWSLVMYSDIRNRILDSIYFGFVNMIYNSICKKIMTETGLEFFALIANDIYRILEIEVTIYFILFGIISVVNWGAEGFYDDEGSQIILFLCIAFHVLFFVKEPSFSSELFTLVDHITMVISYLQNIN